MVETHPLFSAFSDEPFAPWVDEPEVLTRFAHGDTPVDQPPRDCSAAQDLVPGHLANLRHPTKRGVSSCDAAATLFMNTPVAERPPRPVESTVAGLGDLLLMDQSRTGHSALMHSRPSAPKSSDLHPQ